ncbi:hypothetical protein QVD99_002958 [Batrachochytrium dendrobatidis]|nr:hypothetical protein O5D80_003149 [Batrachochytrium dendrobatidis]KAK5671201.1 hypothetical protein QVD99_002958 [Batrachochytrium dendrobatidis]
MKDTFSAASNRLEPGDARRSLVFRFGSYSCYSMVFSQRSIGIRRPKIVVIILSVALTTMLYALAKISIYSYSYSSSIIDSNVLDDYINLNKSTGLSNGQPSLCRNSDPTECRPRRRITVQEMISVISKLQSVNQNQRKIHFRDLTGLGNAARIYKDAFDIYYQISVYQPNVTVKLSIEKELLKLEKKLYPWVINGPMHSSAIDALFNSSGRGIVITTGSKYALVAKHTITMLRLIKSTLPIEIMYCGADDLGTNEFKMLSMLPNVRVVDMRSVLGLKRCEKGWENKPFAVLASRFNQVILMDADALFFQPPEVLFEIPRYKETGTLLFRDRTLPFGTYGRGQNLVNMLMDIAKPFKNQLLYSENRLMRHMTSDEIDSGVVVWNKSKAMPAILLTCLLNSAPFKNHIYSNSWGDKETYWLAHEALRIPFSVASDNGGAIGQLIHSDGADMVCGGLYHADDMDRPLWFNGGIGSRIPAKELGITQVQHWAIERTGANVKWEIATEPFCLHGKLDSPLGVNYSHIGKLTPNELNLARNMTELWVELFQL